MDRVKGWFWKSSSSEDDKGLSNKSQEIQPVLNKTSTQDNKDVTSEITNENNSSLEQFKTVPVKPVIVEDVSKAPLRYRLLTSIKTKAQNASDKLAPWFEKNTHLQPEDCLMCKLSLTSCVTLLYISSLFWTSNHRHSYKTKRFGILMYTVGCFGMWAVFMKQEWYVALTEPPGNKPRNFFAAMASDVQRFSELIKPVTDDNGDD